MNKEYLSNNAFRTYSILLRQCASLLPTSKKSRLSSKFFTMFTLKVKHFEQLLRYTNLPQYRCMNPFYSPSSIKSNPIKFTYSSPPHQSHSIHSNSYLDSSCGQDYLVLHSITNTFNSPRLTSRASNEEKNDQYASFRCRRKRREFTIQGSQNLIFQSAFQNSNKEPTKQLSIVRYPTSQRSKDAEESFTTNSPSSQIQGIVSQKQENIQQIGAFNKPVVMKQNMPSQKCHFAKIKFRSRKIECKLSNAKLEDFQIGQMIGKGSIGKVYMVKHKITNFYYALKVIQKKQVKDINQLIYGIKCHSFLNHPNLAQLYACFHDKVSVYILMELCVDHDLSKHKKKIKNDEQKDKIVMGIAKGVQYMHTYFLRHGDLKLQNILITLGFPKISDFDCIFNCRQKSIPVIRRRSKLWGSPAYFSPDMMKQSAICLEDDIWSIGIITYELYCSIHPFNLKGTQDLQNIISQQMYPIFNVKQSAKSLILSMLEKNKQKRATIEQILKYFV